MLDLKITTLIIEKDQKALNQTVSVLKKFDELLIVGKTISGKQGFALGNTFIPQLVFINIDLPDMCGLDFVQTLRNRNLYPEIIFITATEKYAYESLILEPFDYFVLPLKLELITNMIARFKAKLKKEELFRKMDIYSQTNQVAAKRVFYQKKGIIILPLNEIVFSKAKRSKSNIKLRNGDDVKLATSLNETLEVINNSHFVRIGRSYCINKNYLRKIDKRNLKCILYHNGQTWEVPVSRNTIGVLEKLNVHPIY